MENNYISEQELFEKEWKQKCGDSLKVIQKVIKPRGEGKKGNLYLYKIRFIKYPFEKDVYKKHIINGSVVNPEIEKYEFINKDFSQNCGDSLKILKKSDKKDYWICEFQKYKYIIEAQKMNILKGSVINPLIEKENFIGKIFKQNCGDSAKVLNKINQKIGTNCLYEIEFQKYPCKIIAQKIHILNGSIVNPQIEQIEFIDKIWPQNCGDSLKVFNKIFIKEENCYYWNVEFINYPYKLKAKKENIIRGTIDNPILPWRTKEGLLQAIKTFNHKPTIEELSNYFNINITTIGKNITKFGLREYLQYWVSSKENELKNFCSKLLNKNLNSYNDKNYEIDIYIPNKNLGIEYNGNYWHSELYKENNYHQKKSLYFKNKNINLIHTFEYEWLNKQNILKSLIKSKLGLFEKRIGASKCKIKKLDYKEYADFCNENHLQGECGAKVKLGLFYKNELVQIMSFGVPRFTDKYEWEIIRECSKLGYIIIGGKERLWKYFIKTYFPKNCISYCDFSKFTGESYLKLGFNFNKLNKPGFVWYDKQLNQVFWRNPYKNQEMKNNYNKIYDCGQLVFTWHK